ncbi:transmembrane protein, putative (macronuclear) [Tetrahymena thermophila SB210]|uniref:Transmembrane protein, putative n=1 Tax=Tetrahymena thermophila (strain SB210) TaxID=312017 RepID=I7MDM6_TETTS|nr:transmembrane protein, putative [Tetrahymena thermophila SB210]EAR89894.2 transmembrane protein, putative [Tetrahymena thermophila SB210]|eukprot:XP_001010139.2 transmembrane protein, putative [Tetrahymena thermophila SB210]
MDMDSYQSYLQILKNRCSQRIFKVQIQIKRFLSQNLRANQQLVYIVVGQFFIQQMTQSKQIFLEIGQIYVLIIIPIFRILFSRIKINMSFNMIRRKIKYKQQIKIIKDILLFNFTGLALGLHNIFSTIIMVKIILPIYYYYIAKYQDVKMAIMLQAPVHNATQIIINKINTVYHNVMNITTNLLISAYLVIKHAQIVMDLYLLTAQHAQQKNIYFQIIHVLNVIKQDRLLIEAHVVVLKIINF